MKTLSLLALTVSSLLFISCGGGGSGDLAGLENSELILIYNNISQDGVDNFAQNSVGGDGTFSQYNKDENIYCADFGFSTIATQGNSGGYYTIIYRDDNRQCSESDGSSSDYFGNKNVAFYR